LIMLGPERDPFLRVRAGLGFGFFKGAGFGGGHKGGSPPKHGAGPRKGVAGGLS